MLQIFPFLAYLALVTSAVLLMALTMSGDLSRGHTTVLSVWFVAAAYGQLLGQSAVVATTGLALQTVLAVYLIVRWKMS